MLRSGREGEVGRLGLWVGVCGRGKWEVVVGYEEIENNS